MEAMPTTSHSTDYLMITPSYIPYPGGVERHIQSVHEVLQKKGLTGKILVLSEKPVPSEQATDVIWIDFPRGLTRRRAVLQWRSAKKMFDVIQKLQPKVLHFHDYPALYSFLPLFRYKKLLSKSYITFHGWEGIFPPQPAVIAHREECSRAVAGSIAIGDFIKKWYGGRIDVVSYGGVDVGRFSSDFQLTNGPLRVAYIGRLEADTGLSLIIDALFKLKAQTGNKIQFAFFGAGNLKSELLKFQQTNPGLIEVKDTPNDIASIYREYPVVFASGYLTILEALCSQRFVFACYNNDLRKDYLTLHPASGSIFICGTSDDIMNNVLLCINDPSAVRSRSNPGWNWARQQSWESVADMYLNLWKHSIPGIP